MLIRVVGTRVLGTRVFGICVRGICVLGICVIGICVMGTCVFGVQVPEVGVVDAGPRSVSAALFSILPRSINRCLRSLTAIWTSKSPGCKRPS
jgi:hypothetical protein